MGQRYRLAIDVQLEVPDEIALKAAFLSEDVEGGAFDMPLQLALAQLLVLPMLRATQETDLVDVEDAQVQVMLPITGDGTLPEIVLMRVPDLRAGQQ